MARVPASSRGASRAAYQAGYSRSANAITSRALGSNKVSTPKLRMANTGGGAPASVKSATREYPKGFNVSFGRTGFTDEDWNV